MMTIGSSIAITGATGGLGAALAVACAAPGVTLFLSGRAVDRLDRVARQCRERGAQVHTAVFDITDGTAARDWVLSADRHTPLDAVIANAGLSSGIRPDGSPEDDGEARQVLAVNAGGVINVVAPMVAPMMARGRGRVCLIGSLAGLYGLPFSPAYSASKAAVHAYGQALGGYLRPHGVSVTVICPGYVDTPMSARIVGGRPLMVSADRAAAMILKAMAANRAKLAFPAPLAWGLGLLHFLPRPVAGMFLKLFRFSVRPGNSDVIRP